jgi:protein-S-isoprenylcysteine O-methyltransferase Ste14
MGMASLRRSVVVSILFGILGGPGIVLIYVPFWITRFRIPAGEPAWQMIAAAALILLGVTPGMESARRFVSIGRGTLMPTVPTEHLVVSGFYRYLRNPMYTGVLFALIGEAILFESRAMLIEIAVFWLVVHLFVCFYEEPTLTKRYGDEYQRFKRNVPRWLPRMSPWKNGQA